MHITIVFDTVCPWCFIGKRRLERALRSRPDIQATFSWQPFLLNPEIPPEGTDRSLYLERKYGCRQRVERMYDALTTAGHREGIVFSFERIRRTPNALNSHRLVQWAPPRLQPVLVDTLFTSYFSEGADIGDPGVLAEIAAQCGMEYADTLHFLQSEAGVSSVYNANARSHRMGINGVPCFVFNQTYSLAGAQEAEVLIRMIDLATETQAIDPVSQSTTL